MRTYRLEIRLIQVASILAAIVVVAGFLGLWGQRGGDAGGRDPVQEPVVQEPMQQALTNTKIVALGDSFTFGYPLDPSRSWPKRLGEVLGVEVVNKGKGEQTSKDLRERFDADVVAEQPGRVIIFAGIGDAINEVPLEEVQANVQAMVEKARTNNILPILALPVGYPGYQQRIKEIREWEFGYAQQENIMALDFSTVLFDAEGKYLSGLDSTNGKYPSAKGYETMGDYAAQALK